MMLAIMMFMGKVYGAHFNTAISRAVAARDDVPWRCVPAYIVVRLVGAVGAALTLRWVINLSASYGSNHPAHGASSGAEVSMEALLMLGLVSAIIATASEAQNIGVFGALSVGA